MKKLMLSALLVCLSQNLWAYTKGKVYKLTILHTNDHHGRFWPNKDGELGLAPRATLIQSLRDQVQKEGGHVLLIDAGDVNTGIPQSDLQEAEPDFKGMALLGYDVMALGNHEFDKPFTTLMKQREWAGFPFISANIYHKDTNERVFPSHIVKEIEDMKVTIFGLTTEDTPVKSSPINTKPFNFIPVVEEAKKLVPVLRKDTDILIALTHMGHYADEQNGADAPGDVTLARQVNGIDVIVGGHTQKPLFEPDIQNGSIIVQAHEWGKYVGKVDLEFLDGKVTLVSSKLIPVNLKDSKVKIESDAYVESVLKPFKEKGDAALGIQLGVLEGDLMGLAAVVRSGETNLGNLISRAYKEKMNADIGVTNSGGIRSSVSSGNITYETVLTVLPFGNQLAVTELTGEELKKWLEPVLLTMKGSGGFPQISGVEITVNLEQKKITDFKVNGKPLCLKKVYKIAVPEFTAAGGDKYPVIPFRKTGFVDADILKDYVLANPLIKASDFAVTNYLKYE